MTTRQVDKIVERIVEVPVEKVRTSPRSPLPRDLAAYSRVTEQLTCDVT